MKITRIIAVLMIFGGLLGCGRSINTKNKALTLTIRQQERTMLPMDFLRPKQVGHGSCQVAGCKCRAFQRENVPGTSMKCGNCKHSYLDHKVSIGAPLGK